MNFQLTDEQKEWQEYCRRFATDVIRPVAVKYDREHLLTPDYLVTDGPYRFSRNPLYVGDIVMWVGWAVVFGSPAIASTATRPS